MPEWKLKAQKEIQGNNLPPIHSAALGILFQRGLDDAEKIQRFLYPDYARDVRDPFLFSAMEKAMARIQQARENKEGVAIFGDYDADGVTSTAILKEALTNLGLEVLIYIPDKRSEGYGLNLKAVAEFKEKNVKLILTVDCGITGVAEVKKANELGIDTIVIDHHHVPEIVPEAWVIINPQMTDCGYPEKFLAGVGVVFKFVQALYQKFLPEKINETKWMLDLVAIGTVADCVPLVGENRALAKFGLVVLGKTKRAGLKEIFAVGRINIDEDNPATAWNISFQIAPRINSAGRMDHANTAFDLLMETDPVKARGLALELEANNQKRQKETERVTEEVKIIAENLYKEKKFIFAVSEHFPIGIVGLVAGRISDAQRKPTAVLKKHAEYSEGSFRSIPEINIIETIGECAEYLERFGGHSQAAGVRIKNANLEKFYAKMNELIEKKLAGQDTAPKLEIDAEIGAEDIGFALAETLRKFEPFGEGNRQPVFLTRRLLVEDFTVVGASAKHLKLFLRAEAGAPKIFEAIGFNLAGRFANIKKGDKIDAVYYLEQDEWNGNKKIQLKLIDLRIT